MSKVAIVERDDIEAIFGEEVAKHVFDNKQFGKEDDGKQLSVIVPIVDSEGNVGSVLLFRAPYEYADLFDKDDNDGYHLMIMMATGNNFPLNRYLSTLRIALVRYFDESRQPGVAEIAPFFEWAKTNGYKFAA